MNCLYRGFGAVNLLLRVLKLPATIFYNKKITGSINCPRTIHRLVLYLINLLYIS